VATKQRHEATLGQINAITELESAQCCIHYWQTKCSIQIME